MDVRTHMTCAADGCDLVSQRDLKRAPRTSTCAAGHVSVWAGCGAKRHHASHQWGAGHRDFHCCGFATITSAFILWGDAAPVGAR